MLFAVGGCSLLLTPSAPARPVEGSPATWFLDPDSPAPGPDATSFTAMVTERECAGGRAIRDILLEPVITYGSDVVTVSLYVEPLSAGAHDCQGTAPTPFTIELDEPLGDRQLVDGIGGSEEDPAPG